MIQQVRLIPGVLLGLTISFGAPAQEPRLGLEAGLGQTSNLGRDGFNERDSSFQLIGLDADIGTERPRLEGALTSNLQFLKYSETGVLEDDQEVVGSLDGRLTINIAPERFFWDFQENFGQIRTNPLNAIGPRNRQNVTSLSTGPRVNLPLGRRMSLTFAGSVSELNLEDSESFDNKNTNFQVGLNRQISPVSRLTLAAVTSETEFEGDPQTYKFQNLTVSYDKQLAGGGVQLSVGRGKVESDPTSSSTAIMGFSWDRELGARSRVTVSASKELTDAGQLFRALSGLGSLGAGSGFSSVGAGAANASGLGGAGRIGSINDDRLGEIVLTGNALEQSNLSAAFDVAGERTSLTVTLSSIDSQFEANNGLDNDGLRLTTIVGREFNPSWQGRLELRFTREDFSQVNQEYDDVRARVGATRVLGRRGTLDLSYARNTRSGAMNSYEENYYTVIFGYRFGR